MLKTQFHSSQLLMVCAYKVQILRHFPFIMCKILKAVNTQEGEILGGLGKGGRGHN